MALTKIPSELSSTTGIVDNSNATAITIDSSGNVEVKGGQELRVYRGDNATYGSMKYLTGSGGLQLNDKNGDGISFVQADGATEYMRIDASGNVLVGCTAYPDDTVNNTMGFGVASTGETIAAVNGGRAAVFKRATSDGSIVEFYKDGSTVGSIGTEGGDLAIGNGDAGIQFVNGNEHFRPFNVTTNAATDNLMDIGSSSKRFKDLYLSGGVNFSDASGGTSYGAGNAANTLDDYEEGTWTPDIRRNDGTVSATFTVKSGTATYVKIGRLVYVKAFINSISDGSSNGSSYWRINGTPFAGTQYAALLLGYNNTPADGVYIGDAGGNFILTVGASPLYGSIGSNKKFMLAFTYETDS